MKRTFVAALGGIVLVAPVHAAGGAADPLEAARQRLLVSRPAEAEALLTEHLRQHPDQPDALRLLANAYAAEQRYSDAVATIDRAAALAPADLDIRLARARILTWAGRLAEARQEEKAIAAIAPGNVELAEARHATEEKMSARHQAGISFSQGISRVSLTSGRTSTWYDSILSGYVRTAPGSTVSADIERDRRTFATDTRLSARWDMALSSAFSFHLGAAGTIHQDFRERWSLSGGGEATLNKNLSLLLNVRHADYGVSSVTAVEPGFRLRPGTLPVSLTATWINLIEDDGHHRNGVSGRLDVGLPHDRTLFAGAASYPDTEAGITRQTRAAFVGGAIPVNDRLTFRLSGSYERREQSYMQRTVTASLGWRFGG